MSEHSCAHEEAASAHCRGLLQQAAALAQKDAGAALAVAQAALVAARALPRPHPLRRDLIAEGWAAVANGRRLTEDYDGAARAFREVKKVFRLTPETRGLGARLLRLEATYLRDVREFPRAQQNLRRAIKLCQLAGDRRLEGQTRLARSRLFEAEGSRHEAFRELLTALPLLDPTADCDALFFAFHCAAGFLAELERPHQAQVLLATIERYYGLFGGELLQLRACWLKGKVCAALRRWDVAEQFLERSRAGFLSRGLPYDAALAGLELALVWLEQGSHWRVADLAREMFAVFSAKEIPREASAALLLFANAASRGTITVAEARALLARATAAACPRRT